MERHGEGWEGDEESAELSHVYQLRRGGWGYEENVGSFWMELFCIDMETAKDDMACVVECGTSVCVQLLVRLVLLIIHSAMAFLPMDVSNHF